MIINQQQMLFFLLLTGAYLPLDVVDLITESSFTLTLLDFIPIRKLGIFQFSINWFDFEQTDSTLSDIGVTSGSAFVNKFSMFELLRK